MHVLIVDDEPTIAHLLAITLSLDGLQTQEWSDHFDAITTTVDWPRVDVVIVDQLLGIYDGRQLLKWLTKEHPHVRRIMLTGDNKVEPDTTFADTVLIKPASPDLIRDAVHDR